MFSCVEHEKSFITWGGYVRFWCYKRVALVGQECILYYMGLVAKKPVFGVSDQVRLKPVCSDTETSLILKFSI